MNVGVVASGHLPDAGGGFTFENELLLHLVRRTGSSRHRFTLVCEESSAQRISRVIGNTTTNLGLISYKSPNIFQRATSKFQRESAIFRAMWRKPSQLDQIAGRHGLDFFWFLGPGSYLVNAPYLTIVWDLQHLITPWFPEFSGHGVWDARELAMGWFLRRASFVVTGTHVGKEQVVRAYGIPEERVRILPHPTPLWIRSNQSGGVATTLPTPYLLYPAQFWPHKNHANLLRALKILRDEYSFSVALVLTGSDKGNRGFIETLAKELNVADQVRILGFVSERELAALYQGALALTYVSFGGPENLPPLEAMACGCPVLAADIPGSSEQIGDSALLVDPKMPESIAAGIWRIAKDDRLREELRANGSRRALQWSVQDFVSGIISLFDDFDRIRRCWQ